MPSNLKNAVLSGAPWINGWSLVPSAVGLEAYAQLGWNSVTVDLQHGWWDYAGALTGLVALQAYNIVPFVRVPWNEPGILGKMLDAGSRGLICPMVNSADDARRLVAACLYPPHGERSTGPVRGPLGKARPDNQAEINDSILILPQIETAQAVANLDAILDVPGVGGVYVGPSDLGASYGYPATMDREEPEILRIYDEILSACARRNLVAAIHNTRPDYAARMIGLGFRLVTVGSDLGFMIGGALAAVKQLRNAADTSPAGTY